MIISIYIIYNTIIIFSSSNNKTGNKNLIFPI